LRSLDSEGVIKVINLEEFSQRRAIIFEDFTGEPIRNFISDKGFPIGEFLHLAIQIAEVLGQIHDTNIIHKDISPSNILFNPKTGKIKIIDFGSSTSLSHEIPSILAPNLLEGTLSYISPEQTGRMNRLIDYRTDFYSLGATLYHLILGFLLSNPTTLWSLFMLISQKIRLHRILLTKVFPSPFQTSS
jgi:serine/threonine protein kinase